MESDERYIESCFGKKAPFTVPEGYFDNLTQNIMNSVEAADKVVPHVPEPTQHNKVITINWWHRCRRYAAVDLNCQTDTRSSDRRADGD